MTTVDQAFRSVVRAWPVMVRVLNQLEKSRLRGPLSHNGGSLYAEVEALIRHWPSALQLARAYHTVVEDEFGSQSYPESARQVERWHTIAVNELNAELGITHCNGKDRHLLHPEIVAILAVAVGDPEFRVQPIHGDGVPPLHLLRGFLVRLRTELILYNRVVRTGKL